MTADFMRRMASEIADVGRRLDGIRRMLDGEASAVDKSLAGGSGIKGIDRLRDWLHGGAGEWPAGLPGTVSAALQEFDEQRRRIESMSMMSTTIASLLGMAPMSAAPPEAVSDGRAPAPPAGVGAPDQCPNREPGFRHAWFVLPGTFVARCAHCPAEDRSIEKTLPVDILMNQIEEFGKACEGMGPGEREKNEDIAARRETIRKIVQGAYRRD